MAPGKVCGGIPKSPKLQAAIGRVAILHGLMELVLRMTIKSICEMSPGEAQRTHITAGLLLPSIEKVAQKRFGDGPAVDKLQTLLDRCRVLSKERNKLMHSVFARASDGVEVFLGSGDLEPLSTVQRLDTLATEIKAVTDKLNHARRKGFLKKAIEQSKPIKLGE
jgi:hypothetical protein